jgi:ATP adenylyltransferase
MKCSHRFRTDYATDAYSASRNLWDTPVFESESFVALPTVGALVEGWLLVVPRIPALSFAHVSEKQFSELGIFLDEIIHVLESNYGRVAIFEHGPSSVKSNMGCGVDYAHLHLVPTECDLMSGAKEIAPNIRWQQVKSLNEIRNTSTNPSGYWFVQQAHGLSPCYVGTISFGDPISQLFRKVIANYLGRESDYDWKMAPGEALLH